MNNALFLDIVHLTMQYATTVDCGWTVCGKVFNVYEDGRWPRATLVGAATTCLFCATVNHAEEG